MAYEVSQRTLIPQTANARAPRQGLVFFGNSGANIAYTEAFGIGDFTFSAIVSSYSITSSTYTWIFGGDTNSLAIAIKTTAIRLTKVDSQEIDLISYSFLPNKPYLITVTRKSGIRYTYVNGSLVQQASDTNSYTGSTRYLNGYNSSTSLSTGCLIEFPLIYNRGLSESEVISIYETGSAAPGDYNSATNTIISSTTFAIDLSGAGYLSGISSAQFTLTYTSGNIPYVYNDGILPVGIGKKVRLRFSLNRASGGAVLIAIGEAGTGANLDVQLGPLTPAYGTATYYDVELTQNYSYTNPRIYIYPQTGLPATFTVTSYMVNRLGLLVATDSSQFGGGDVWYDVSGNNQYISFNLTNGVSWSIPFGGAIVSNKTDLYLKSNYSSTTGIFLQPGSSSYVNIYQSTLSSASDTRGLSIRNILNTRILGLGVGNTYTWIQSFDDFPLVINELGGNVLIGLTINSGYKLDVGGTARFSGKITTSTSSITYASINIPHGSTPLAPNNGDMWTTTTGLYIQINGVTVGPLGTGGGGGAVSSVSGTTNQVTVSPTTGAVVVSLPTSIINVNSLTAQSVTDFTINAGSSGATIVAGQGANGSVVLTAKGTGGVGIGTSTPASMLDISNTVYASGQGPTFRMGNAHGSDALLVDAYANNTGGTYAGEGLGGSVRVLMKPVGGYYSLIGTDSNSNLGFVSNSLIRMRILSGGNVLIGGSVDGGQKLQVSGNSVIYSTGLKSIAETPLVIGTATGGANDFQLVFYRTNAGSAGSFYSIESVEQGISYRNLVLQPNGGNVGIGASPLAKLHVDNGTGTALYIDTTVADNNTRDAIYLYENESQATGRQAISWYNGSQNYYKARIWTEVGGSYAATQFGIDVADDSRSVATRLLIRNGNIGIGTTSLVAGYKLDVNGAVLLNGNNSEYTGGLGFDRTYPIHGSIWVDSDGGTFFSYMGYYGHKWETASGIKMYLTQAGNLGIGTTNPAFKLDNYNDTFRSLSVAAEKLIWVNFPNGVANQKVDIIFDITPGGTVFWGNLEVEITSGYDNQNSVGKLIKVFSVGLNPAGGSGPYNSAMYDNTSYYSAAYGVVADNWAIDGIFFNTTTGKYYFTVIHRVSTGNSIQIKVKGFSQGVSHSTSISTLTAGSVYTTNTTVYYKPVIESVAQRIGYNGNINQTASLAVEGNVGIGTINPTVTLDIGKNSSIPALSITNSNYSGSYGSLWGLTSGAESIMIFGNNSRNEIRAGNTGVGGYLDFYTNNTANYTSNSDGNFVMRLFASGNVGVGSGSDYGYKLLVSGPNDTQMMINDSSGTGSTALFLGVSGAEKAAIRHTSSTNIFKIGTFTSGGTTILCSNSFETALTLDSNKNANFVKAIGFGGASANTYYYINGSPSLSGNANQAVFLTSSTFGSDCTGQGNVIWITPKTTAASYTMAALAGLKIESPIIGAGSVVTTAYGVRIASITGGQTNYAILTNSGLVSIGDTTASTSTNTGALTVSGGVGIAGNTVIGGYLNIANNLDGVTLPGNGTTTHANIIGWNRSGGVGEMDFINAKGGGSAGGFRFAKFDGTTLTNQLVIDGSGNVGIGTTSPQNKFVVSNSGACGIEFAPGVNVGGLTNISYIASYDRNLTSYRDLIFDLGGTYVSFKNSGNVGIGTASPSVGFEYQSNTPTNTADKMILQGGYPSGGGGQDYGFYQAYTLKHSSTLAIWTAARIKAVESPGFGGQLIFETNPAPGTAGTATTAAMRIAANGNISVYSTTASSSTSTGALIVSGGVGIAGAIYAGGILSVAGTGVSQIQGTLLVGNQGAIGASLDVQTASGTASTFRLYQNGVSNWVWSVPASTDALVLSQYGSTEAMRFDSSRNATFTAGVTVNGVLTANTSLESLRANRNISGGGIITVDASYNVIWSSRFIVISNGRGSNFSTNGYFDITCPTSGTITGVGGATSVTATSNGIPLAAWTALYYILPIGSGNSSLAANFRVVSYTSDINIPAEWVLICIRNGDSDYTYFANGIVLSANQSSVGGLQTNANTANSVVKRDGSGNFSANAATFEGQVNGNAGYRFRGATGTFYELLRYVGGSNNPGLYARVTEATSAVRLDASGSNGPFLFEIASGGTLSATFNGANTTLAGNLTVSGSLTVQDGTESTGVFGLKSFTKSLQIGTTWLDTGISGTDLTTGSYLVQVYVNNYTVSGGQYDEYYTGTMSWFSTTTNSTDYDEIVLHKAGHAPNGNWINLRTVRQAPNLTLKLQIIASGNTSGAVNYVFKFRRLV